MSGGEISPQAQLTQIHAEDAPAVDGSPGVFVLGVRNDAATVVTSANADYSQVSVDSSGRVGISDLGGSITIDGTVGATNDPTYPEDAAHVSGDRGNFVLGVRNDTGAVLTSADGDYTPFSTDSAGRIRATLQSARAEDSAAASGDIGNFTLGVRNDTAAVVTSTDGDYSQISTDSAGRIGITDLGGSISIDDNGGSVTVDGTVIANIGPVTSGGLSMYKNIDVNATGVNIKASAGQVYTIVAQNRSNAERFVKLYNKASAPTVGTDTPVATFVLQSKTDQISIDISAGLTFSLGIGIGATTGIADANTGNPSANDVVVFIGYK